MFHFELGFPYFAEINKQSMKVLRRAANLFEIEMKKLGTPVKAFRVFDMLKKGESYYLHFHYASLPVGDVRKFGQNCHTAREKVMKETEMPFIVRIEGYKPKKSLFDYFSKRMAGMFGHECKGTAQTFSSMMSLEQYYKLFYHTKHLYTSLGWKPEVDSNLVNIVLSKPEICPHCSHNTFHLVSNRALGIPDNPHPP